jgi:Photosynthesis system II assembly factor YCF48
MGHEDRERNFEQALAWHLRGDGAGARNGADARAEVRSEPGETELCPDAGTLAAFHEGLLLNEERNVTTEHIAGCSRCQQVLLLLEATDEIPLPVEMENDLKIRELVLSTGASDVDYPARQKPSAANAGQPEPALKTPADISNGRGFKALRWAAPAGAIAAGLLIWFVTQTNRPVNKLRATAQSENVQVAQEQPRSEQLTAPRPLPASPPAEPLTKTKQLNEPRKDNGRSRQGDAESGAAHAQEPFMPNLEAKSASRGVVASNSSTTARSGNSPAKAAMGARDLSNLIALAPAPKAETEPPKQSSDSVSASAARIDTSSADLSKQSAVPAPPASSGASANAAEKKAGATPTQTVILGCPVAPPVPTERMAVPDKLHEPSLETRGKTAKGKNITSASGCFRPLLAPGGRVQWRLGAEGQIERSVDGGVSWLRQSSGVKTELLAGSAPSESVCWIIGRGGTILKTSDGGVHWSKVAWASPGEITGVQAFDSMHAVVYGGTEVMPSRFATNDGGATWFRTNK